MGRALECYRVAAHVAEGGSFVQVAAQAGEVCLRIGLTSGQGEWPEGLDVAVEVRPVDEEEGMQIAQACSEMGGTLQAIGQMIKACLSPEILKFKYVTSFSVQRRWISLLITLFLTVSIYFF